MVPAPDVVEQKCAVYTREGAYLDLGDFAGTCVDQADLCAEQTATWSVWMKIDPLMLEQDWTRFFVSTGGRTFRARGITVVRMHHGELRIELRSAVIGGSWAKSYLLSGIPFGEWFHLAIVGDLNYQGTGLFVYMNGVELPDPITYNRPVSPNDICNSLYLSGPGPCRTAKDANMYSVASAAYSNLMVFDSALSPDDVHTLYACGSLGKQASPTLDQFHGAA